MCLALNPVASVEPIPDSLTLSLGVMCSMIKEMLLFLIRELECDCQTVGVEGVVCHHTSSATCHRSFILMLAS